MKTVKKRAPKEEISIRCKACGKVKPATEYYNSYNEAHPDGKIPYCKSCMKSMSNNIDNEIDREKSLSLLRTIDRPYIDRLWKTAVKQGGSSIMGRYIRLINLPQYQSYRWLDGDLHKLNQKQKELKPQLTETKYVEPVKTEIEKFEQFKVTNEIIALFGPNYTDEEYFLMWNKYKFLGANYKEQTNMHTEALITYIRYKVKEEMAVSNGRATEAKTWGELAMKQADKAKINPSQFNKADLQGGLSTIGEIAQAVEQNQDIIPILPKFRYRPADAVDFCIWNYINYARDLEGKPAIEYKDVYEFYDRAKEEYIASTGDPNGLFNNDPTVKNRDKINNFIQLPDDYYEESEE